MLVQFSLKNFMSFHDRTTLDMTAITAYKEHSDNLIDNGTKEQLLRVASIYGANASGKSNLYLAMFYFQQIIKESLNYADDDESLAISKYYCPFEFIQEKENTEFEVLVLNNQFEYKYGYEYNQKRIVSEWMYRKNILTNRKSTVFERDNDNIVFGASVRKECDTYKEQIPSETLALTFFNKLKLKTDVFTGIYKEIMDISVANSDSFEKLSIIERFLPEVIDNDKEGLLNFLSAIDTGIKDIKYEINDIDIIFRTVHLDEKGKDYHIDLLDESEGTIKSIGIYIFAKAAILFNKVMFVDELNTKLHPLLLKFIIDLFYEKSSKAQLIYTTHDTTLLDKKFFRRDQIWFVQKDEAGRSQLTALSDFKVRSDASFEKDYLAGVYGGIPLLKDFELKAGE